ncbi:hypothetical protein DAPPUDRAFT_119450 [Daphnia pulex]|uniref:CCHC-type domain-containing protein n=1 Tax=Daphnia pulex TaxID=6669 RepID=E9HYJ9_DAPPU|nr:hypothetical protein DAPPUDRAFT_119450 [Daphnia pulex]|eukprot:EFX63181.1 hypothetical protein DAPPUDRAFT_119450 [Daphnia pulex]
MEVMKVRLREFGTVLDLRRDRYAGATAGMIPCLTGQLTGRMTLNSPIPSYLQVGEHKVYIRYANQPVTCRECNLPGHMALDCPARKNRLLPAPPKIVPQKTNGGKEKSMAAALQSASRSPSTPTELPPLPDRSWTVVSRRKKNQNKTEGDETVLVPEKPPIIVLPSAESSTEIVVESQDMETLSAEPTPTGEVLLDLAKEHGRTDMSASEFEKDMSAIETSVPACPHHQREDGRDRGNKRKRKTNHEEVAFSSCPILESLFQVFASPGPNKADTAVLVSKTLKEQSHTCDPDGRLLCINLGPVSFVSLYAPSGRIFRDERSTFFRVIVPAFLSCVKEPIVLMGDFNAVDDRGDRLRKAGTTPSTPVDHALVALVGGLELVDVWKALRPRDSGHTYFNQGGSARIDRIYCSRSIRQEFTLITTDTKYVTDHAVLHAASSIIPVIPTPRPPRPSIWKLNTKILSEDAFRRQLTTFIRHAAALPLKSVNVVTWWDSVFKPGVKRIAQSYCRRRASLVKEMGQFYQNCLVEITDPTTELDWPTFQALREEARELHLRALTQVAQIYPLDIQEMD